MTYVFDVIVLAVVVCLVILGSIYLKENTAEVKAKRINEQIVRTEQTLQTPGAKLLCLGCEKWFEGPLDYSTGCPHCHMIGLVLTEEQVKAQKLKVGT